MALIFVARSATLSDWASDVGLGKHVFKLGVADEAAGESVADLIAKGWAGQTDWTLVKEQDGVDIAEEQAIERAARKEKMVDPTYYPRIKGTRGIFKVNPTNLHNHILVARVMAGEEERAPIKPKVGDFAAYLIHCALR